MGSIHNVPAHWKVKFWRGVASWVVFMPDRGEGPADVCSLDHGPHSPITQPRLASRLTASVFSISPGGGGDGGQNRAGSSVPFTNGATETPHV